MFCEVTVGGVTLELTSTHLLAGGGLLPRPPWRAPRRPSGAPTPRSTSCGRSSTTITEPGNRQLVVGDFNVPAAARSTASADRRRIASSATRFDGLDDLWCRDADRGPGPTADIVEGTPPFRTDATDERFYVDGPVDEPDAA